MYIICVHNRSKVMLMLWDMCWYGHLGSCDVKLCQEFLCPGCSGPLTLQGSPECFSAKILHASPSIYWLIWHVGHFLSLGDMQAWPWLSRGSPRKVCPAWKPPTFLKDWRIYKILSKHLKGRFGLFVGLVRMYVHTSYFIHHVIQGMYLAKDKINPRVQQPLVTYIVV